MSVLTEEIDGVERLLALYRRKAELLGNQSIYTNETCPSPHQTPTTWARIKPCASDTLAIEKVLVDRAAIVLDSNATAIKLISWRPHTIGRRKKLGEQDSETVDYLLVGYASGIVELRHPKSFNVLWQLQTNLDSIKSIHAVAGSRPVFAVASKKGEIIVYSARIFENNRLRVGDHLRERLTDQPICLATASVDHPLELLYTITHTKSYKVTSQAPSKGFHMEFHQHFHIPAFIHSNEMSFKVQVLQVHFDIYTVVGTSHGSLTIYNKYGHCVYNEDSLYPILDIAPLIGGSFAFTSGKAIGIYHIPDWNHPIFYCDGVNHPIVQLVRDAHRPSILFAITSIGSILSIKLHRSTSTQQSSCSIQQQLASPDLDGMPAKWVHISSMKRLLFTVVNNSLSGFGVGDASDSRLVFATNVGNETQILLTRDKANDALVIFASKLRNGSTLLVAHESLVAHQNPYFMRLYRSPYIKYSRISKYTVTRFQRKQFTVNY